MTLYSYLGLQWGRDWRLSTLGGCQRPGRSRESALSPRLARQDTKKAIAVHSVDMAAGRVSYERAATFVGWPHERLFWFPGQCSIPLGSADAHSGKPPARAVWHFGLPPRLLYRNSTTYHPEHQRRILWRLVRVQRLNAHSYLIRMKSSEDWEDGNPIHVIVGSKAAFLNYCTFTPSKE